MPYRRQYRKKIYRKKRTYRRNAGWQSTAVQALRTAKWVASLVNTEFKHNDTQIAMSMNNTAYNQAAITIMPQGDDDNERNGRSVLAKALEFQLRLSLDPTNTIGHGTVRIVLVRDTTCDGTLPNMADIFDTISTDQAVNSFRNISTAPTKKYQIWWDKRFSLDVDYKDEIYISKYIKLKKSHVKYLGTGFAASDCGPGNFFLCAISTGDATFTRFNLAGYSRFRYIDN